MRVDCILMGNMGYNLISWVIRALMPSNSFESSFSPHKKSKQSVSGITLLLALLAKQVYNINNIISNLNTISNSV